MPKSPSRSSTKAQEEEIRILETMKRQPEILESLNQIFASGGRKKQMMAHCEEFAEEFNVTADTMKKAWLKTRQNSETKKVKDSAETRPKSARSNSIEPRETRRSLRSQSIDKTISITSTTLLDSTDNSCASSACSSPRPADKQQQQQQQQRSSRRNLCAINEDDINPNASAIVASAADSIQQQQQQAAKEEEKEQEDVNATILQLLVDTDVTDEPNISSKLVPLTSMTSYQSNGTSEETMKQQRTLRFSEPVQTPRNTQPSGHSSRRLSISTCSKETRQQNNSSRSLSNPEDPTRVFFESMALTVMGFPQHLQASVKARVSTIIYDVEYDLALPINNADKTITVAS